MNTKRYHIVVGIIIALLMIISMGCASRSDNTPDVPSASSVRSALLAANPNGLIPGTTFNAAVLPECELPVTGGDLWYTIAFYDHNHWLDIGSESDDRTVTLSENLTTIPEDADLVDEERVYYECDSTIPLLGQDDYTNFNIADLNNNGTADALEHGISYLPWLSNNGYIPMSAENRSLYRAIATNDDGDALAPRVSNTFAFSSVFPYLFGTMTEVGLDNDGDGVDNALDTNPFVAASDGEFADQVTYDVLPLPDAIVTADYDSDGNLDLAVTSSSDNKVSVLLGVGDGTFGDKTDFDVGTAPWGMTTADFDNDGTLDLATANYNDESVSLLLGDGEGSFGDATSTAVREGPIDILSADFDEDGNVDLAVGIAGTASADNVVTILFGQGDGTFDDAINLEVGFFPNHLTSADFDNDGDLDIAVTNRGSNGDATTLSVLLGDGDGGFADAVDYTTNEGPAGIVTADFDGDGNLDLAVANNRRDDGSTVSILLGEGDGAFADKSDISVGTAPYEIVALDVEGDGDIDMVVSDTNRLRVYENDGDASFTSGAVLTPNASTYNLYMTVGDYDGDYDLDLAFANFSNATVGVFLNQ